MIYTLALDDAGTALDPAARGEFRTKWNELLEEPIDPVEAEEWKQERWGLSAEARAEAEQTDNALAAFGVDDELVIPESD